MEPSTSKPVQRPVTSVSAKSARPIAPDDEDLLNIFKKTKLEEEKLKVLDFKFRSLLHMQNEENTSWIRETYKFRDELAECVFNGLTKQNYACDYIRELSKIHSLLQKYDGSWCVHLQTGTKIQEHLERFGKDLAEVTKEQNKLTVDITQTMKKAKKMNTIAEQCKENIQQSLNKMEDGQSQLLEEKHLRILNKMEEINDVADAERKRQTELLQKMSEQMREFHQQKEQLGMLVHEVKKIGDVNHEVNTTLNEVVPDVQGLSELAKIFKDFTFILMLPLVIGFFLVFGLVLYSDDDEVLE